MTEADLLELALALAEAERSRVPLSPLTSRFPSMTVSDAYQIQRLNIQRRLEAGCTVRGHKIGLTARAMQQLFGVFEPDYGHLLDDMFLLENTDVKLDRFISPRIEIETAFILGKSLKGPGVTVADAIRAVEWIVPSIEIIDSRIDSWQIKLPDTIADNGSSAAVILGGHPLRLTDVDLRNLDASLAVNGVVVETGNTSAVLGNPLSALAWLTNALGLRGVHLEEGHVVLPGTCIRAVALERGMSVIGHFEVLGDVKVDIV